jgi:uncharacterized protein YeaO (DUF488 family)
MIINTTQLIPNQTCPNIIDITVKSAHSKIGKFFAPTWYMVKALRPDDSIDLYDWTQFQLDYNHLLYDRIVNDRNSILTFITKNYKQITLGCYCQEGQNCHRNLARTIIQEYCEFANIPVETGIFIK